MTATSWAAGIQFARPPHLNITTDTSASAILNPKGRYYDQLKRTWATEFQDTYWAEDAIFMERNSRDFVSRIDRINTNAEAICDVLRSDNRGTIRQSSLQLFSVVVADICTPIVKQVNYPKHSPSRPFYEVCRTANGGYGGLLSATFFCREDAVAFFDNLATAKGPSLGTNFTLRLVSLWVGICV